MKTKEPRTGRSPDSEWIDVWKKSHCRDFSAPEMRVVDGGSMLLEAQIASLKKEVAGLRAIVQIQQQLIDPYELRAMQQLQAETPSHEELSAIAKASYVPESFSG